MSGYTIILVDSEDPSDSSGDFIHVESFASVKELMEVPAPGAYPEWVDRVCRTALQAEERWAHVDKR